MMLENTLSPHLKYVPKVEVFCSHLSYTRQIFSGPMYFSQVGTKALLDIQLSDVGVG